MTTITWAQSGKTLRGRAAVEDLSVAMAVDPNTVTTTTHTVNDAIVATDTVANGFASGTLSAPANVGSQGVTYQSQTPAVCSVDSSGRVAKVSNGTCLILVQSKKDSLVFQQPISGTPLVSTRLQQYVAGSLARHVSDAMASLVAGKTPDDATLLNYSTYSGDYPSLTIARNPQNFAAGIDLTGMSVARSDLSTGYWPACLVSKRHYIAANHVTGANFSFCWLAADGTQVRATALSHTNIAGTDLHVGYLDQDMPASIKRFKVLPANFRSYLPSSGTYWLPSLSKRQVVGNDASAAINTPKYDALRVLPVKFIDTESTYYGSNGHYAYVPVIGKLDPADPLRAWQVPLHSGDSSGPSWLLINGEAVLLGHYAEVTGAPHLGDYITQVEAAMNSLASAQGDGTSYSLTKISLAGFNAY